VPTHPHSSEMCRRAFRRSQFNASAAACNFTSSIRALVAPSCSGANFDGPCGFSLQEHRREISLGASCDAFNRLRLERRRRFAGVNMNKSDASRWPARLAVLLEMADGATALDWAQHFYSPHLRRNKPDV